MIEFCFEDIDRNVPGFNQEHFCFLGSKVFEEYGYLEGDVSYQFGSDEWLLKANIEFLQHDYYTDIITFDYSDVLVDVSILISIDRVKDNAKKDGECYLDAIARVMFHGLLHCVGFNDKTKEQQKLMTEKEDFYVNLLKRNVSRGTFEL